MEKRTYRGVSLALTVILLLTMAFSLSACGSKQLTQETFVKVMRENGFGIKNESEDGMIALSATDTNETMMFTFVTSENINDIEEGMQELEPNLTDYLTIIKDERDSSSAFVEGYTDKTYMYIIREEKTFFIAVSEMAYKDVMVDIMKQMGVKV